MPNINLLLIDDEPIYANLVETILDKNRYLLHKAFNGKDGLNKISENTYDIILLDWNLPDMTGIEICNILKNYAVTKNIPIIMLTSMANTQNKVDGLSAGADDYLTKPFDGKELLARIDVILRREKNTAEIIETNMDRVSKYIPDELLSRIKDKTHDAGGQKEQIITVMFVDLCNFTNMTAEMAPAEIKVLLDGYFKFLSEIIYQHGGNIDKFIGDAVLALFGTPTPHSNDPRRAINAAMDIQKNIGTFIKNWKEPLKTRIGINTGKAIIGIVGSDLRADYTAIGNTVNFASKIQNAAKPGQIAVSQSAIDAAGKYYTFKEIPINQQNIPMKIYEIKGYLDETKN